MSQKDEKARFDAAVQAEVGKIIAVQQTQFAQMMEQAMKASLQGMENASQALEKERKAVEEELDAAKEARAKAEKEGDQMAQAYFEGRQKQFMETARTELLRDLVLLHLKSGKNPNDIANWLNIKADFVEKIHQLLKRAPRKTADKPRRLSIAGTPSIRYENNGRGGTIWFESAEISFDMWWEFAGGTALAIIDIPTRETWELRTKLPLGKREEVLQFIGEQVVKDQTSGEGSYLIGENVLTIYAYQY